MELPFVGDTVNAFVTGFQSIVAWSRATGARRHSMKFIPIRPKLKRYQREELT